jgi:hypothetical protein
MKPIQPLGTFLCCGEVPYFGSHTYHSYEGKTNLPGTGIYCDKCHKSVSTIGGGVEFAAYNWNKSFLKTPANYDSLEGFDPQPPINAPEGFMFASMHLDLSYMGGTVERSRDFVLFSTSKDLSKCLKSKNGSSHVIDKHRHLPDITLMDMDGVKHTVPLGKGAYAYMVASFSSAGNYYPVLNVSSYTNSGFYKLFNFFHMVFPPTKGTLSR